MADSDPLLEELTGWLEQIQGRVQRLLDPANGLDRQQRTEELLRLSQRFLDLSRSFLALGQQMSDAARSLLSAPPTGG